MPSKAHLHRGMGLTEKASVPTQAKPKPSSLASRRPLIASDHGAAAHSILPVQNCKISLALAVSHRSQAHLT